MVSGKWAEVCFCRNEVQPTGEKIENMVFVKNRHLGLLVRAVGFFPALYLLILARTLVFFKLCHACIAVAMQPSFSTVKISIS